MMQRLDVVKLVFRLLFAGVQSVPRQVKPARDSTISHSGGNVLKPPDCLVRLCRLNSSSHQEKSDSERHSQES